MKKPSKYPIVAELKHPLLFAIFLVTFLGVFYLNYYAMRYLPGTDGYACIIGHGFTPLNIIFSIVISLMAGLLMAGLINSVNKKNLQANSAAGVGVLLGTLTTFCTVCTIPVISLFGFSIGLGFITQFELIFKVAALILMGIAIHLMNAQLKNECMICIK